jgi:16S rRNA (cytosine967-C5)-methyltransferase
VLARLEQGRLLVHEALARGRQRWQLDDRSRALVEQLVYGVTRRRLTLNWLVRRFARKSSLHPRPAVRRILNLALYQLVFMEQLPAFAVVDEAVKQADQQASRKEAGFVNALLRRASRTITAKVDCSYGSFIGADRFYIRGGRGCVFSEPVFPEPEKDFERYISIAYSYPAFVIRRWVQRFGKEGAWEIARVGNEPPPTFIRVNTRRTSPRELKARLEAQGIAAERTPVDAVLRASDPGKLHETEAFKQGLFYTQDLTAFRVSLALEPGEGEQVLELCAGRGGKTTHLAQLVGPEGRVTAADSSKHRLAELSDSARRLGYDNIECVEAEGRELPGRLQRGFHAVLLDAPCSSTGVVRRRVEARYRVNQETIERLSALQLGLLQAAADMLSQGGRLVYSTCSIEPEENQKLVAKFLSGRKGLILDYLKEFRPEPEGGDGGFVARLRKQGG